MKRSFSGWWGFAGSKRISEKKSAATTSAADAQVVGWPLPAAVVARIESMRSWVAMLWSTGTSRARSCDTGTSEKWESIKPGRPCCNRKLSKHVQDREGVRRAEEPLLPVAGRQRA